MNTIRRGRRRPRQRSVNFRAFGWVLIREAALRVLMEPRLEPRVESWRSWLTAARTTAVIQAATWVLRQHPERRYFP